VVVHLRAPRTAADRAVLRERATWPNVDLRVPPFDPELHAGQDGPFILLSLPDGLLPDDVHQEYAVGGHAIDTPTVAAELDTLFSELHDRCLDPNREPINGECPPEEGPAPMTHQEEIVHSTVTPPQQALGNLINQLWKTQAIHVADRLHLAEALADGTHTVARLAEMTGTHAPSLYRLLRALASIGIFTELDGSHFANSELSHFPAS
jgi:hypothetical protein